MLILAGVIATAVALSTTLNTKEAIYAVLMKITNQKQKEKKKKTKEKEEKGRKGKKGNH